MEFQHLLAIIILQVSFYNNITIWLAPDTENKCPITHAPRSLFQGSQLWISSPIVLPLLLPQYGYLSPTCERDFSVLVSFCLTLHNDIL